MSGASIQAGQGEVINLSGDLVIRNIPGLLKQSRPLFDGLQSAVVDFGDVDRVDSAALGLMLEWLSWTKGSATLLRFRNVPDDLLRIARLSNLEGMLPLA
jgi:phospholipid transport system transporter-binding protein